MHALAPVLFSAMLGGPLEEPVLLEYAGNLIAEPRGEEPVGVKRFTMTALVRPEGGGHTLAFVVTEQGGGEWPWPERFGRVGVAKGEATGKVLPRLLHTFNGTKYPIDLPLPSFPAAARVRAGDEWVEGKYAYTVAGSAQIGDRETDRVDVATNFGLYQSLWLEDGQLLVKADRKLFLGRGDRFRMTLRLVSAKTVETAELETVDAALEEGLAIQETLDREERETKPEIAEAALESIAARVETFAEKAKDTWLEELARSVVRDVAAQSKRSADVDDLAEKFVGMQAPEITLTGLDGKPLEIEKGKPLLLHFWDYRHDNLEEPYGQVGYIGFLQGKREKLGLRIVGVAVDKGLGNAGQSAAVKRSIRKLREFMRIRYPIAVDDGTLLAEFGDPRRLGAKLPLWVLIDHEGNVHSYHAGLYEADPRKGLVDLDAEVVAALRKMYGRDESKP